MEVYKCGFEDHYPQRTLVVQYKDNLFKSTLTSYEAPFFRGVAKETCVLRRRPAALSTRVFGVTLVVNYVFRPW